MGTWTTKFRKPALVAGAVGNQPGGESRDREGLGFRFEARRCRVHRRRHHRRGGCRPDRHGGWRVAGGIIGERSHKKSVALAERKAEAALLASEVETLEELAEQPSKARRAQVGADRAVPHRRDGGPRQRSRTHRQTGRAGCRARGCARAGFGLRGLAWWRCRSTRPCRRSAPRWWRSSWRKPACRRSA